jgi:hypothetical protein
VSLILSLLLCAVAAVASSGSADASVAPCTSGAQWCLAPSTVALSTSGPYCTPFPDGREWQDYVDANQVRQYWTYSNGSNACVRVSYTTPASTYPYSCRFYFYVPTNGYANAVIYFGTRQAGQTTWNNGAFRLDEFSASGWVQLFLVGASSGIAEIRFQDNDGQAAGSHYLGWGVNNYSSTDPAAYGIKQVC